MAVGNFLGTRAERQHHQRLREIEMEHIARYPDGEREEIRQIFAAKGFEGYELESAVNIITSDAQRWVDMMLTWGVSFMILMVLIEFVVFRFWERRTFAWRHQIAS